MKIHQYLGTLFILAVFLYPLLLTSCADENEFTMGDEFIESETNIRLIDTFSVKLSTVLLDSLPTSTVDTLLIGNYRDNIFGRVTCNSYFEIGLPDGTEVLDADYYDSLTISLWYTGYSYGDTLNPMRISVYQLSEEIELRESGYLYNCSSFAHEENPLATYTFEPRPNSKDSIEFKIRDEIGQLLFDMMRSEDDDISSETLFLQFFKGLVIKADTNYNASVVGFDTETGHLKLTLYTHRIDETLQEIEYDFPVINTEQQFNQVDHDFSNSILNSYSFRGSAIPSTEMGDKAFAQGGTGIMTKIEFPTLDEFLLFEKSFLLRAELIIKPAKMSYNTFELPETIYLYNTDKHNEIGSILYNSDDEVLTPTFNFDELFYEETSYTYDLTNFIKSEMSDSYFDTEHGLIMTFAYEEYLCSLKRIVVEALDDAAMLKIYYVTY